MSHDLMENTHTARSSGEKEKPRVNNNNDDNTIASDVYHITDDLMCIPFEEK